MLDGKAYRAHFPDELRTDAGPGQPDYRALLAALAALEEEFRDILSRSTVDDRPASNASDS